MSQRTTKAPRNAEAAKHGRSVRFSVSFRPILADTEEAAWARAENILAETKRLRVVQGYNRGGPQQSEGARRLLAAADKGPRIDKRLWTAIAQRQPPCRFAGRYRTTDKPKLRLLQAFAHESR